MVNINNVYRKVLALSNKEQRGYITPQNFNLLADKAQGEIFNNYFYKIKSTDAKLKTQVDYRDELEMLEEKLHPFHVDTTVSTDSATLTLPAATHKIIDVTSGSNKVTQVNKSEIAYTQNNPLLRATANRMVYVREDSGLITLYPSPTSSTDFEISYYKRPSVPSWGYVVANEKALYNSNTSVNFELHSSEEEELVSRILLFAGVAIKQQDIQQAGVASLQLNKQEQNS